MLPRPLRLVRLISDEFNFGRANPKPNFGLSWFQSAAAPARHVFGVASKVPSGDEPRATHVTHARLQPQTETASPKLEPAFACPELKTSEIRRTSLTVVIDEELWYVDRKSIFDNQGGLQVKNRLVSFEYGHFP